MMRLLLVVCALLGISMGPVVGQVSTALHAGVDEHPGRLIPGSLVFHDQDGHAIRFSDMTGTRRPILLIPAYYSCPMLCGLVLRSVARGLKTLAWKPGDQYRVITVSFDERDRAMDARQKQASILAYLADKDRFSASAWPFLTADGPTIVTLLDALGERIQTMAGGQIAHPAVIMVLTPHGRISRYLYGIDHQPLDLKLALLQASHGQTGSTIDRILMYCYQYDPSTERYGLFIANVLRIGAACIIVSGLILVIFLIRWTRSRAPP